MSVWHYRAQNSEQAKAFDEAMANQTSMYRSAVCPVIVFVFDKSLTCEVATPAFSLQSSTITRG